MANRVSSSSSTKTSSALTSISHQGSSESSGCTEPSGSGTAVSASQVVAPGNAAHQRPFPAAAPVSPAATTWTRSATFAPSRPGVPMPSIRAGTQTTPSIMSVTATGSVIALDGPRTETRSPSRTPSAAALDADSRATSGRAVPARWGSPSSPRPPSRFIRQQVSTNPAPGCSAAAGTVTAGSVTATGANSRSPVHTPSRAMSADAAAGVWVNRSTSISTPRVSRILASSRVPACGSAAENGRVRPSQLT